MSIEDSTGASGSSSIPEPDQEILRSIGTRLVAFRGQRTQKQVSEAIGVHTNTLIRYEKGHRAPDGDTLLKLCRLYGVSADEVLFGQVAALQGQSQYQAFSEQILPGVDESALAMVIEAVEQGLEDIGHRLHVQNRAKLISTFYRMYANAGAPPDPNSIRQMIAHLEEFKRSAD